MSLEPNDPTPCPVCDRAFDYADELLAHLEGHPGFKTWANGSRPRERPTHLALVRERHGKRHLWTACESTFASPVERTEELDRALAMRKGTFETEAVTCGTCLRTRAFLEALQAGGAYGDGPTHEKAPIEEDPYELVRVPRGEWENVNRQVHDLNVVAFASYRSVLGAHGPHTPPWFDHLDPERSPVREALRVGERIGEGGLGPGGWLEAMNAKWDEAERRSREGPVERHERLLREAGETAGDPTGDDA